MKKAKPSEKTESVRIRRTWKLGARRLLMALAGALIYAVGLGFFLEPNRLSAGGIAGIALLVSQAVPVGTGILILILNIPVMLLGMWKFGVRFMSMTVGVLVVSSPLIDLFASWGALTEVPLLAALAGGALMGTGMGVLYRAGASSGGMDVIAKLIHLRFPYFKTGGIFLVLDSIVLAATALVFRDVDLALYAAVGILVSTYLLNIVLYGSDEARMVYIISDKPEELAEMILKRDRGVTFLQGYGAYSGNEKKVLLCVLRPKELPFARELVASCDPNAFMIVAGASAVFGEGFKPYGAEDL
ncbi:MAG: YitT family protein [Oscillospiraceae bacterium]|nr:YitT family protein [Oscillospiraceae bacterium]